MVVAFDWLCGCVVGLLHRRGGRGRFAAMRGRRRDIEPIPSEFTGFLQQAHAMRGRGRGGLAMYQDIARAGHSHRNHQKDKKRRKPDEPSNWLAPSLTINR
jgi:hypothetical protein